ncbi:hypothetical protein RF55_5022 [Lasius niger]|uniref:Uncharacterized protein n=1 Tax=Lasius niger TaxID=67767 RepID=A0A0J7NQS3_LASNI|nr:hypothetical protein RF55_5022 [Lasius niger]
MDMSDDEDMFAISDEETSLPTQTAPSNPVEEHLLKQLADVQNRIDVTTNEIAELYTVEGQPILKKKGQRRTNNAEINVEIVSQWQCVLQDKWIIGVELQNVSCW